jgi:hypothetical protein
MDISPASLGWYFAPISPAHDASCLGTLTPTPLPKGEGLGAARNFPLYLRERGTEGVREPRGRLVCTL